MRARQSLPVSKATIRIGGLYPAANHSGTDSAKIRGLYVATEIGAVDFGLLAFTADALFGLNLRRHRLAHLCIALMMTPRAKPTVGRRAQMAVTAVEAWDERWATPEGRADWLAPHPAVSALVPVLMARGTQHVLDLGCGVGRHALLFAGFELLSLTQEEQRRPGSWHWHILAERR